MTHPRLLPGTAVVPLSDDAAVIGSLHVRGLPPRGSEALAALDGTRSPELVARQTRVDEGWLSGVVAELGRLGALADAAPTGVVAVLGGGSLAGALVAVLSAEGVAVTEGEPNGGFERAACVVLAPDRADVDRCLTDALLRDDVPHLLVLPEPAGARVGPFVLPGLSACQRCVDERLAERDRGWGRRAVLAGRAAATPGPGATSWAVGLATSHVLAFLGGDTPASAGTTWHLARQGLSTRSWPLHDRCGCAAPGLQTSPSLQRDPLAGADVVVREMPGQRPAA